MIHSFEKLKKIASRAGTKKKGKRLGHSEFLHYNPSENVLTCYRPMGGTGGKRSGFDETGFDPEKSCILAVITPERFVMTKYFAQLHSDVIYDIFNIIVRSLSGTPFIAGLKVQASDAHQVVTPFPATYEWGVGFTAVTAPQILDHDSEKRKALNKLIREKRHMLKTRAKLGASFTMTPETLAKNIVAGRSSEGNQNSLRELIARSSYLASYFHSSDSPRAASHALRLLVAAETGSLDSLSSVIGVNQLQTEFLRSNQESAFLDHANLETHVTTFINDKTTRMYQRLRDYNDLPPMQKYQDFEAMLIRMKPAMRRAYGADFFRKITQDEAKEALENSL
jgi:hypothetical protein